MKPFVTIILALLLLCGTNTYSQSNSPLLEGT